MDIKGLIIPTEIPWDKIKGKELEELLYWLILEMGAKDLQWRIGGSSGGAADQGRDLECSFYEKTAEGDLIRQKWWIDAKGRKGTVERHAVQEAVLNAAAADIDTFLVATNTQFSNPTRDWVSSFQKKNPSPKILLWEKTELEKHCSENPLPILRLHAKALSEKGLLEVVHSKFWNYMQPATPKELERLWSASKKLVFSPSDILALIISEHANKTVELRRWVSLVENKTLVESLLHFLINFFYIHDRASTRGYQDGFLLNSVVYLIIESLRRVGPEIVYELLSDWSFYDEERAWPEGVRKFIISPIIQTLMDDLRDVCSSNCSRISKTNPTLTSEEIQGYWDKYNKLIEREEEKEEASPTHYLVIEKEDAKCEVGFCVGKHKPCPLFNLEDNVEVEDLRKTIDTAHKIIQFRSKQSD